MARSGSDQQVENQWLYKASLFLELTRNSWRLTKQSSLLDWQPVIGVQRLTISWGLLEMTVGCLLFLPRPFRSALSAKAGDCLRQPKQVAMSINGLDRHELGWVIF